MIYGGQAALQLLFVLFKYRAQLLANFERLLLQCFGDVSQVYFHLKDDIHQPLDRLFVHTVVPFEKHNPLVADQKPPLPNEIIRN